jgi:integrase
MDRYVVEALPAKAPRTQHDYTRAIALLRPVFGHMAPSGLKPRHVYAYMSQRPHVAANREKACLSAIMTECVRWGAVDRNLVREVKRNKETPRDRYVSDGEVDAFLEYANPMIRAFVALQLCTGLRQGQILGLRRSAWDGSRLTVAGPKGGKTVVYSGDSLSSAIDAILALGKDKTTTSALYLLSSRMGSRYTPDGFRAIWQRCMSAYIEKTGAEGFTSHDLRAKVASDSADLITASARLGHQSMSTTNRVYRRRPIEVTALSRKTERDS